MYSDRPGMAAQDGFTLVELLIAATMMMVVLSASLAAIVGVDRGQREVASRTDELALARQGVERMTREIRQATSVDNVGPATLTVTTIVHINGNTTPTTRQVTYTCTTSCTRTVQGYAAQTIVPNVTNSDIFTTQSTNNVVNYVAFNIVVKVRTATSANGSFTLADGVDLRNAPA